MGKRANGEGTVYQRKDGRWVASITLEEGKRKSIYCKTQKEAIKIARSERAGNAHYDCRSNLKHILNGMA